jgi:fatty acid desaturase
MQERFDRENIAIVAAQALAWGASLVALDRLHHPALRVAVVLFFCALMQGVFSMMHECFHGHAHGKRRLNDVLGTINATLFGTSYTLFAVNHHGHHVRNRTRAERVDYIYPDESAAKKIVSYYVAILGGIWLLGLVISLLAVFLPHRALGLLAQRRRDNTYAAAFDDFTSAAWLRLRLEALGGALFWLAV